MVFWRKTKNIKEQEQQDHDDRMIHRPSDPELEPPTEYDADLDPNFIENELEEDEVEMSVVFSDPSLPDNPMIFVSDEFEAQTGYSPEEAVGRNCRFLQGPETNEHAIEAIRQGLKAETRFTIDILNYK